MATKAKASSESAEKAALAVVPEAKSTNVSSRKTKASGGPADGGPGVPETADEAAEGSNPERPAVESSLHREPVTAQNQKWQEIRHILEILKEDTLREIRKSVKNGTEAVAAIEPGGDIYDQASSERDRELGLLLGDREREKIHSIDEALLRIDDGDYGICEECDEDIPLGRLKAMPFTRHCVKCKSDLEKLQAQTKRVEEERAYREIPLSDEEE